MSLIVQKFGGTSVADTDSLRIVAERIIDCKKNGNDVVVVPSAMGSSTDELTQLANDLSENQHQGNWICSYQQVRESQCLYYQCI